MTLEVPLEELATRTSAKWRVYPEDVLPMWVAEMDFPLAVPIARTLHEAVDRSDTGYRFPAGLAESLVAFCQRTWDFEPDVDSVLVYADVMSAIAYTLSVFTKPGELVVINPPVYHPFFSTVQDVAKRGLAEVPLLRDGQAWALDFDGLAAAFARPEVTAYLMCNPHNPTGTVFSAADLARVAMLARANDVLVLVDEIHAPLVLPGATHTPYVSLGTDVVGDAFSYISASKGWNIAGLKCAQLIASSPELAKRMNDELPYEASFGTGHFGVLAAIAAYNDGEAWMAQVHAHLDRMRALVAELLAEQAPWVGYAPPQASYLAWLDFRETDLGNDPAEALLERERLALNSGLMFGREGAGFARLNFATSEELVREAVRRISLCR